MAVHLLLTTLQAKSKAEVNQILLDKTSKEILRNVADNASSIGVGQTAKKEEDHERKEQITTNSDITDTEFDFDDETINTPAYRRAFAAARRRAESANQSSLRPGLDGSNPSKRQKPTRTNSEHVSSQFVKTSVDGNGSSDTEVTDEPLEVVGSSINDSAAKASSLTRIESNLSPTRTYSHKRSTSDHTDGTVIEDSKPSASPRWPLLGPTGGSQPVATQAQAPQPNQYIRTLSQTMRDREDRNRRRHGEADERINRTPESPEKKPGEAQINSTRLSSFPHTSERWETLSSHWEGLTNYWIWRMEDGQKEGENAPLNQQVARQITDLSGAGSNLFTAVVELQRLRASSERKFQQWFIDTRAEEERSLEVRSTLQKSLQEEREKLSIAHEERAAAVHAVQELRRELTIAKDEARRAWEELGHRESMERVTELPSPHALAQQHSELTITMGQRPIASPPLSVLQSSQFATIVE